MTAIKDQLQTDLGDAMKDRDEISVATIRLALAAIKKAEVAGDSVVTLTDEQVVDKTGKPLAHWAPRPRSSSGTCRRRWTTTRSPRSSPRRLRPSPTAASPAARRWAR